MTGWAAGLFQFNIWSFAVPAAIVTGYLWSVRRARQAGLASREFENSVEWTVAGSLFVSHIVEILLYQPQKLKAEGVLTLLKFWDGLSSFGGFLGAIITCTIYFRVLRHRRWWIDADFIIQGLITGWIFGRIGCTVSGDHPGPRTTVPWAFHYPDGPRHNMGMYEMLYTALLLFPANLLLHRFKPPVGSFVALNCILYGAGRFALDFLRATDRSDADPRYLGLTLGHYCSLALVLFGLIVAVQAKRGKLGALPPPAAKTDASGSTSA
ncbi:MAG: prolipoprotein diacylglyceryl transferase [Planctomycetes bacterium]|nr:prolipoprotein diacylglyceryl transferase [Planctomycetota bacterium]